MSQTQDFSSRAGDIALRIPTAKPVSPKQLRWRSSIAPKPSKSCEKVEHYATPEAIFEHTILDLNKMK